MWRKEAVQGLSRAAADIISDMIAAPQMTVRAPQPYKDRPSTGPKKAEKILKDSKKKRKGRLGDAASLERYGVDDM